MATPYSKQISNRNFLSPIGFKFSLVKEPKVAFFCNAASIPEITLGTSVQTSYLKDIDVPGDKIAYGDLNIRFLVDEDLQNYMAIHNWITGLGFPESTQEYKDAITNDRGLRDEDYVFSDGSLRILNSNYNDIAVVKFKDLFPVSLTSLTFDTSLTDVEYLTADVVFRYTIYDILDPQGNPL
jgi:hypothetical protein